MVEKSSNSWKNEQVIVPLLSIQDANKHFSTQYDM